MQSPAAATTWLSRAVAPLALAGPGPASLLPVGRSMVPALTCPVLRLALDTAINGYYYLGSGPLQRKFIVSER